MISTYLLLAIVWSAAFVLLAMWPVVAEVRAGRSVLALWRSPFALTVGGVFMVFLGSLLAAALRWVCEVFDVTIPDPALLVCYAVIIVAAILTLKPQASQHPWRWRLHNTGLVTMAVSYIVGW